MEAIITHLQTDPVLKKVLEKTGLIPPRHDADIYLRLLRAITGQQLSTKAAATIWGRFLELFPEKYPVPNILIEADDQLLRSCGLSFQKSRYIRNIARFANENPLAKEHLNSMGDEEIITYLTSIKGVGKWTVEMLLMFALGRPNVFPIDDLGIRNAMISLYGLKSSGKALRSELETIAAHWSPYRSYACMSLWDWKDSQ